MEQHHPAEHPFLSGKALDEIDPGREVSDVDRYPRFMPQGVTLRDFSGKVGEEKLIELPAGRPECRGIKRNLS